jgi:hypothetical protein
MNETFARPVDAAKDPALAGYWSGFDVF